MNEYFNPVHTIEGRGCVRKLPALLEEAGYLNKKKLFVLWNDSVKAHPGVAEVLKDEENCKTVCFSESNPTVEQLFAIFKETAADAPELVIAVGGGSTLDVGKSLCCLYGHDVADADALRALIAEKAFGKPKARWIGIPTTAGTGSETTCWATIWDPSHHAKRSVENHENYAWYALVDSEMENGIPLGLAVSSALDACAHAVESYWARKTNAVSRALALSAVRCIMTHMDALLQNEETAHEAMSRSSMMAGLAFSNTKTTACHSISYPLTMRYRIPHGAAVSMLLAPVLKLNAEKTEELPALLDALGVQSAEELEKKVCGWLEAAGIPYRLRDWSAKEEDLPLLASEGITKGRADNNPVEIDPETVLGILKQIY